MIIEQMKFRSEVLIAISLKHREVLCAHKMQEQQFKHGL